MNQASQTHLDAIAKVFQQTIDKMVAELKNIAKEIPTPEFEFDAQDIICSDDLPVWDKLLSLAQTYSDRCASFGEFHDIKRECVECAIAQYNKEVRVDRLLDEMKAKLMALPSSSELATSELAINNTPSELAIRAMINTWGEVIAANRHKDYDFRLHGECAAKVIQSWTQKAEVIVKDYIKEIELTREDLF